MIDGIGTTKFTWTLGDQLATEDGPWSSDTISYTYTARQRTGLNLVQPNASPWFQTYGYDSAMRLTNVFSPAGHFSYAYWSPLGTVASDRVRYLNLPGGSYIDNSFDGLARLVDTHLNTPFGGPYGGSTYVSQHQYSYDSGNQRTQQVFAAGNYVNYTYDSIGQLTGAKGYEPSGSTRLHEQFGYGYDSAWNLNARTNNGLVQSFVVNSLNELTNVAGSGTLTVAGTASEQKTNPATFVIYGVTNVTVNSQTADLYLDGSFAKDGFTVTNGDNSYTAIAKDNFGRIDTNTIVSTLQSSVNCLYDLNGNMVTNGTRIFDYDDENQLVRITEPGSWKSEFSYDGMMRRRIRKEFTWQSSSWVQTNELRYNYDGMLVVQERDGDNLARVTYTRGNDLSGSLQGAGGIGGLLARSDNSQTLSPEPRLADAYYHSDGNGNITMLVNTDGVPLAHYAYDPYGNLLSMTGPLAIANHYRFSSKEWISNSGLYYYGFRYYSPILQRWLNKDPIQETGGINLFRYAGNNPLSSIDPYGNACPAAAGVLVGTGESLTVLIPPVAIIAGTVAVVGAGMYVYNITPVYPSSRMPPIGLSVVNSPPLIASTVIDTTANPPFKGDPGSTVRGPTASREYGPDGYPLKDRDWPHGPGHPAPGNGDHSHDWGRPSDGGKPTDVDRGPGRAPQTGDPPPPRGPNVDPPQCTTK
jgi:RHS repeat-associated protein